MTISKTPNSSNPDYLQAEEMIDNAIAEMGERTHIEYEGINKPPHRKRLCKLFKKWFRL
jgi:hypothetical protein